MQASEIATDDLLREIKTILAGTEGSIGVKALCGQLDTAFDLPKKAMRERQEEVKALLMQAMAEANAEEDDDNDDSSSSSSDEEVIDVGRLRAETVKARSDKGDGKKSKKKGKGDKKADKKSSKKSSKKSKKSSKADSSDDGSDDDSHSDSSSGDSEDEETSSAEEMGYDGPVEAAGKDRTGQRADFESFLHKRGDLGFIKAWKKRYFRLYRKEGVIAYFKNDKVMQQIGEIPLTGAFIVEKNDFKKFGFSIQMKVTARVWILNAKDEEQRKAWMDECRRVMKPVELPPVAKRGGKNQPTGEPLMYPPIHCQGWEDLPACYATLQDDAATFEVPAVPREVGFVGLSLQPGVTVVEEVRSVDIAEGTGEAFITDLPRRLRDQPESVSFVPTDPNAPVHLVASRFLYDDVTQVELLRKVVGRQVTVSQTRNDAFHHDVSFAGTLVYHAKDEQFAVVSSDGSFHFLDANEAHSIKVEDLQEGDGAPAAFFEQGRLWATFVGAAGPTVGALYYRLPGDAITWEANYNVLLTPREDSATVTGWWTLDNQSGKAYTGAHVEVVTNAAAEKARAAAKSKLEQVEAAVEGAVEDEVEEQAAKKGGLFGKMAAALKKKPVAEAPLPALKHRYAVSRPVTLPAWQKAHVSFAAARVAASTMHLVTFDTPKYTLKPRLGEAEGTDAVGKAVTVLRFVNPVEGPIPGGSVSVLRQRKDLSGTEEVVKASIGHHEAGHVVDVPLNTANGISATRVQTGFNNDADKCFMIETVEITVANGRLETVDVVVEDSMFRWQTWELTSSVPVAELSQVHPRHAFWKVRLNCGEHKTIKYTVFYSAYVVDREEDDEDDDEAAASTQ